MTKRRDVIIKKQRYVFIVSMARQILLNIAMAAFRYFASDITNDAHIAETNFTFVNAR